jgi:uncharacterized protein YggE
MSVGRVVQVHEQGATPPQPILMRQEMAMDVSPGAYSAGSTEVRAVVVVSFALED